MKTEHTEMLAV